MKSHRNYACTNACMNSEGARTIEMHSNNVNRKYMENFSQKTETKEKEACCLTLSRIPGLAYC